MKESSRKPEKGTDGKEKPNPSFCSSKINFGSAGFSFSYLFFMLLYSILLYYGFMTILVDYIADLIKLTQMVIFICISLGIIFLLIIVMSYRHGKFQFLYFISRIILGVIISNLGLVYFLSQNYSLSYMEILNLFLYLVLISAVISVIAFGLVKMLQTIRCKGD